jgi:hypothetical protein
VNDGKGRVPDREPEMPFATSVTPFLTDRTLTRSRMNEVAPTAKSPTTMVAAVTTVDGITHRPKSLSRRDNWASGEVMTLPGARTARLQTDTVRLGLCEGDLANPLQGASAGAGASVWTSRRGSAGERERLAGGRAPPAALPECRW